ncbi:hypothetical protein KKE19_02770 [Patescibacteria group bacterium]|nr:hypothetical protein [Patescibacteria group bacterium]MBU4274713.1 hypothetical protein [Patescibacteria group bacterium]MBU4367860.1 hypothetical protein [Patescibacteria group bacterium]MBU4461685.1 hypothetical protein [Patescibacteria group bacterium]MCG2700306.1 hypothetical protein [Candidatus Parcubacteria bacterium]
MIRISIEPIPGGKAVVNSGFGNRCICGSYFDECGICNYGHEQGKTYYLSSKKAKPKMTTATPVATEMVTCEVFDSCKCTICGGYFADGDDICAGGHQIGHQYSRNVAQVS